MGVGGGARNVQRAPIYIHIHVYGTFTANGNIFVRPSSSVHSATPWGYRVSFDLTVPGRKARSEAYELRWETSPPVWWDKEKRACRCEISLKWKLVNCWVDNSWVFWFVLVFLSKRWADNVIRNERNRRGFDGFLSIFIFFSRITSWNVIPHLFHISSILGIWSNVFLFWWGWNHLQFERSLNCGSKHVEVESRCCSQRLFKIPHKPSPTGSIPTSSFSQLGGSVFNQHEDGICQPWLFWVYP